MHSPDRDVFQSALSDFAFEAACGGAIRHLADSGFTVKQIMEKLDFPISEERVRTALYKHFCDTCVILEQSPEEGLPGEKPEYVLEYNSYGKPSYRRKSAPGSRKMGADVDQGRAVWKETAYTPGKAAGAPGAGAELSVYLAGRISSKQQRPVYISCDFGIPDSAAAKGISMLNGRQREYLEGISWPRRRVYHRLDHRMTEILCSLYERRAYEGNCYFTASMEKMHIG